MVRSENERQVGGMLLEGNVFEEVVVVVAVEGGEMTGKETD